MKLLTACALLLALFAPRAAAQSVVSYDRTANLVSVSKPDPTFQPRTLQSRGDERRQGIIVNGIAMRLHFAVPQQPPGVTWRVAILDRNLVEVWSYSSSQTGASDFWSGKIEDDRVTVAFRGGSAAAAATIKIDNVLKYVQQAHDQSIIGPRDLKDLPPDPTVRQWSRGVAHIQFVSDKDGQEYICTGFMISRDLLITNRHCIASPAEAGSATLLFDYDSEQATVLKQSFPQQQLGIVLSSCDLDFTLLRLSSPFAAGDGRTLKLSTADPIGQNLIIIQHAGGTHKRVSIIDCKVVNAGRSGNSSLGTDFGHTCDTLKSSSGSPTIVYEAGSDRGAVVGLHHLSAPKHLQGLGGPDEVNLAVSIKQIVSYIQRVNPALLAGVTVQ